MITLISSSSVSRTSKHALKNGLAKQFRLIEWKREVIIAWPHNYIPFFVLQNVIAKCRDETYRAKSVSSTYRINEKQSSTIRSNLAHPTLSNWPLHPISSKGPDSIDWINPTKSTTEMIKLGKLILNTANPQGKL